MVKADLTRDYYGDLELTSKATEVEIKKQFRQLALKYHPDRNPGRELEVNAKFQTIQSAHEVLTDPEQRAKYDLGRSRGIGGGGFGSQARPASGFARGNPWANVATDFPPPPRATRSRAQPPPSAGAQRYANNFKPGPGAFGSGPAGAKTTADSAAEARRKTYEAWSTMGGGRPAPSTPQGFPPPPGAERRSSRQQVPKPQPPPIPRRNGFAPGNPGGDEPPAANTSAYHTQRTNRAPTAKQQPSNVTPPKTQPVDPLKQFREQAGTPLEPRLSTPYAGHGGEKTDPFESLNLGRSNSTRATSRKTDDNRGSFGSPRTRERRRSASPTRQTRKPNLSSEFNADGRVNSDSNMNTSPKRTYSKSTRPTNMNGPHARSAADESATSSDESEIGMTPRVYAKSRSRKTQAQTASGGTSKSSQDHQSYGAQRAAESNADPKMYGAPDLPYVRPQYLRTARRSPSVFVSTPKRSGSQGQRPSTRASSEAYSKKWPNLFPSIPGLSPPNSPSGDLFNSSSCGMNAFEAEQFNILDKLVKKHDESSPITAGKVTSATTHEDCEKGDTSPRTQTEHPIPNSSRQTKTPIVGNATSTPQPSTYSDLSGGAFSLAGFYIVPGNRVIGSIEHPDLDFECWDEFCVCIENSRSLNADFAGCFSFTFQVDGQTYTAHSHPRQQFTSSSTENISTTFTPTDWHGKFEAGEDYFGKEAAARPSRGNSNSRSRNRSPPKPRVPVSSKQAYPNIDPEIIRQSSTDGSTSSPGGTKFSAEEWAQTFKPTTFAPPPHPSPGAIGGKSRTNSSRRTKTSSSSSKGPAVSKTAGTAVLIDSDDESDKPLFMGSRPVQHTTTTTTSGTPQQPSAGSPNAMDIDPPLPPNDARNVNVEPTRPEWRAGDSSSTGFATTSAPGPTPPPEEAINPQRRTTSSRTSDFATSLDDLKKTEPIYTPPTGLSSFADLNANLPFTSKASISTPLGNGFTAAPQLDLPHPPRGPSQPKIPPDANRPTKEAWEAYLSSMTAYMAQWDTFNKKMTQHFVARRDEVDGFPKGWLGMIGGRDIGRYCRGLKEDEVVRTWWDTACQKHGAVMEDFVWVRDVYMNGVAAAGPRGGGLGGEKLFGEVS